MAPAPAPWAVLGDALWCLGLGCLLAAARDALRLVLGEGKLRCFLRDAAFFAAAAVLICGFAAGTSAGGLARWYMSAAVLLGRCAGTGPCSPPYTGRRQCWRYCCSARCTQPTKCCCSRCRIAPHRPARCAKAAKLQKNPGKPKIPPKNSCKSRR